MTVRDAASVTILVIDYRAHCTAPACTNFARRISRYAERGGGRPLAKLGRDAFEVIGEFYPLGVRMWRMFQARSDPSPATRRAEDATA
jgi:hypothetical protein